MGHPSTGGQNKLLKNQLKTTLRMCGINPARLEATAADSFTWHQQCQEVQLPEVKRAEHRLVKHQKDIRLWLYLLQRVRSDLALSEIGSVHHTSSSKNSEVVVEVIIGT